MNFLDGKWERTVHSAPPLPLWVWDLNWGEMLSLLMSWGRDSSVVEAPSLLFMFLLEWWVTASHSLKVVWTMRSITLVLQSNFLSEQKMSLTKGWLGTLAAPASKVEKGVLLSYRRQPGMGCLLGALIAASSPSWCHHIWMLSPDSMSDTHGSIKGKTWKDMPMNFLFRCGLILCH